MLEVVNNVLRLSLNETKCGASIKHSVAPIFKRIAFPNPTLLITLQKYFDKLLTLYKMNTSFLGFFLNSGYFLRYLITELALYKYPI